MTSPPRAVGSIDGPEAAVKPNSTVASMATGLPGARSEASTLPMVSMSR
jgi:hypothetical protein